MTLCSQSPAFSEGRVSLQRCASAAPSSIAGPNGSSPRSPMRRVGEQTRATSAWTTKPAGGADHHRVPADPAQVEAEQAGQLDVAHARARCGAISASNRKTANSTTAPIPARSSAGQSRSAPPPRVSRRAPAIPKGGHDDAVGQQPVLQVDDREQHARGGQEQEGGQLPDSPNRHAVRRTARR